MDLKQFEDKLNNKFKDYEPVVDGMKIWDNIEDQLPQPKKKRRFAWFWILVPVILLVGAYFTIDLGSGENSATNGMEDISTLDQNKNTPTPQSIQTETKDEVKVEIEESKDVTLDKTAANGAIIPQETLPVNEKQPNADSEVVFGLVQNNSVDEMNLNSVSTAEPDKENTSINLVEVASNLQLGSDEEEMLESDLVIEKSEEVVSEDEPLLNTETDDNSAIVVTNDEGEQSNPEGSEIEKNAEKLDMVMDPEKAESPVIELDNGLPETNEDERKKFSASSSLSTTFTVFGATRNFFDVTADQQGVIDKRNEVEKSLEAMQIGLEYKHALKKRWSLIGGLRAWQHTRSSNHEVENVTEELMETLTSIDHMPDGTVENVFEDVNTVVTERYTAVRYQRYQSLSALALLNYQLLPGKKTSLELGAGLEIGLLAAQTGYELNTEITEYLMTEDVDERYKKRSGDYLVFRLGSMVDISDHWKWSIGLESKYGLNGIQTDGLGFNQKFNFLGIQTGFNYTF